MRILLTGATGFLGGALALYWAAAGHEVFALIRNNSGRRRLNAPVTGIIQLIYGSDGELFEAVRSANPQVVAHTACVYGRENESLLDIFDVNLRFGVALLQAVVSNAEAPVTVLNSATVLEPETGLYAFSKRQFSNWGAWLALRQPGQLQFVDLRLQHIYGPGDDESKFTSHVLHACYRNDPRLVLTAGEQRRDFIHVEDVVRAYDTVLLNVQALPSVDTIDVGSGTSPTVREFVETVHQLTRSTTQLEFGALPYRHSEPMLCVADTTRLLALGWLPPREMAVGVRNTISKEFSI